MSDQRLTESDREQPADLPDSALPGLFQEADRASLEGQHRYIRLTGWRLILAVAAPIMAAATITVGRNFDIAALGTALAFAAAAALEQSLIQAKPDRAWYDGRAVAESVKTLTWRYAVCADPFPVSLGGTADGLFNQELLLLLKDAPENSLHSTQAPAISAAMRALRGRDLPARRRAYLAGRIIDQQGWYARKADFNRHRARQWRWLLFTLEILGIGGALARAFGVIHTDLTGIVAAMVAAGVAWLGVKQHDSLARAYTFASHELSTIHSRLERPMSEEQWAGEVRDAEEAISREHTMWRASRSALLP
jgi:hypothetical protein